MDVVNPSSAVTIIGILVTPIATYILNAFPEITLEPRTNIFAIEDDAVGITLIEASVDGTKHEYALTSLLKLGVNTQPEIVKADNEETVEATFLVITISYVDVVTPSSAITTIEMLLIPTTKLISYGFPEITLFPFMKILAAGEVLIGVRTIESTAKSTLPIYEVILLSNTGDNTNPEVFIRSREEFVDKTLLYFAKNMFLSGGDAKTDFSADVFLSLKSNDPV
jgi:hypothetical protein